MSKGILGNSGQRLLARSLRHFFHHAQTRLFMLFLPKTLLTSCNQELQTIATHTTSRHCHVRFYTSVRKPLSKEFCFPCYARYLNHTMSSWTLNKKNFV